MILRVIGFIGALGGLFGYLVPPDFPNGQMIAAAVGVSLFILYVVSEIYTFLSNRDFVCKTEDTRKIKCEMERMISVEGRTTILSRDLSWALDDEMMRLLMSKAQRGDLTVHMEKATALSTSLETAGANIIYYEGTGFVPESRFTMMNTGKPHATIAVGFVRDRKHVIKRYRNGEEASFHLAEDLLKSLDAAVATKK